MKHLAALAILLPLYVSAQNNPGARITALGGAGVALQDAWAVQKNQAGLSTVVKPAFSVNYEQRLFNEDVSTQSALFVIPVKVNVLALSFQRYGFSAFNQQKASIAFARPFGSTISAGIGFNYHQLKISGYGSSATISADAGFQFKATRQLTFGAHVSNPSNSNFTSSSGGELPMALSVGTAYQFSSRVLLTTEVEKVLDFATDLKVGLEYGPIKWLALRGGVSTNPFRQYGGVGVNYNRVRFDSTVASDPMTGFSPQVGLTYAF